MLTKKLRGVLRQSNNPFIVYPCTGEILDFEIGGNTVICAIFKPDGGTPVLIRAFEFTAEDGEDPFSEYVMPYFKEIFHLHEEQFDHNVLYPVCGRGAPEMRTAKYRRILPAALFEAADPSMRCKICERIWFPNGQPEWHRRSAMNLINYYREKEE